MKIPYLPTSEHEIGEHIFGKTVKSFFFENNSLQITFSDESFLRVDVVNLPQVEGGILCPFFANEEIIKEIENIKE